MVRWPCWGRSGKRSASDLNAGRDLDAAIRQRKAGSSAVDPGFEYALLREPIRKRGCCFLWRHDADCQRYHGYDESCPRRACLRSSRGRCIACNMGASPGEFVSFACDSEFLSSYFPFQRYLLISKPLLSVEMIILVPVMVLYRDVVSLEFLWMPTLVHVACSGCCFWKISAGTFSPSNAMGKRWQKLGPCRLATRSRR
jgi:hypothetical protein